MSFQTSGRNVIYYKKNGDGIHIFFFSRKVLPCKQLVSLIIYWAFIGVKNELEN